MYLYYKWRVQNLNIVVFLVSLTFLFMTSKSTGYIFLLIKMIKMPRINLCYLHLVTFGGDTPRGHFSMQKLFYKWKTFKEIFWYVKIDPIFLIIRIFFKHDGGTKESNKERPERQSLWSGSCLQRTPQSSFTTATRRMDKLDKWMPEEG